MDLECKKDGMPYGPRYYRRGEILRNVPEPEAALLLETGLCGRAPLAQPPRAQRKPTKKKSGYNRRDLRAE